MPRHFHAVSGMAAVLAAAAFLSAFFSPALAAPVPAPAKTSSAPSTRTYIPHTKSVHAATVKGADEEAVHLSLPNGEDMDADIKPSLSC